MITSKLAFGPMSTEAIDAVFRYSNYYRKQLMLIPSKNQIDTNGGYVNNWTTQQFMDHIRALRQQYPNSNVLVCRDHCGPGFNGKFDIEDVHQTLTDDIKNGFDLIHIDFCHYKGTREESLHAAKKAVELCLALKPDIKIEIGTDENMGTNFSVANLQEIEQEIDFFQAFCKPTFFVVQTGSLVREINQAGNFNADFIGRISSLLHSKGLKLKEHNADYLTKEQLRARVGIVDAQNIAPQFGVIQTSLLLSWCLMYGIDHTQFLDEVYAAGKWKKWLHTNGPENKLLCSLIAGHYHFSSKTYASLVEQLNKHGDFHEEVIDALMKVIGHYEQQ